MAFPIECRGSVSISVIAERVEWPRPIADDDEGLCDAIDKSESDATYRSLQSVNATSDDSRLSG